MSIVYKEISLYTCANKHILVFSTGENKVVGGVSEIGTPIEIQFPIDVKKIQLGIEDAFARCYSENVLQIDKISPIQKYLNINNFVKVTKQYSLITISWENDKGYKMQIWKKRKGDRGYEIEGNEMVWSNQINYNDVVKAIG